MTDGAARLLSRHMGSTTPEPQQEKDVFHKAYEHLVSRDKAKAWTSGQWMTERVGGSDVRNTETLATYCPLSCSTDPAARYSDIDGMHLGP